MTELSFIHRFVPGTTPDAPPILALHGTGGDENDLIPIAAKLSPGSAILSPRGQVSERGMPRFFRRLAEGVFDEADVVNRAGDLASFIAAARKQYGIAAPVAIGFSNGANIAAAVLALHPGALAGAVLIRAMTPLQSMPKADLTGKPILILSGAMDPIVADEDVGGLAASFQASGADTEHVTLPAGHQLTHRDLELASQWFGGHYGANSVRAAG
jgi:phospholipase/carboxylesterase